MSISPIDNQPFLDHIEPVIAVADVTATIKYWQDVLAFPNKWVYGDPIYHGGVSWNNTFLQFTNNAERAKSSAGNYYWIRVKYIAELYKIHQERNADIVSKLETRPWGMDEYTVKDLNGYFIVFSGHANERRKSTTFPANISLVERNPTPEEFIALHHSVGWTDWIGAEHLKTQIDAAVFSVVAVDTNNNEAVGCALVIGDNASFYYIKDVMVKKEWQGKRVGSAMMQAVTDWLNNKGVPKSFVGLFTGENLEPFYQQFGFSRGFGMVRRLREGSK